MNADTRVTHLVNLELKTLLIVRWIKKSFKGALNIIEQNFMICE